MSDHPVSTWPPRGRYSLADLGWTTSLDQDWPPYADPGSVPGRVSRVDRGACDVLTAEGTVRGTLAPGLLAAAGLDGLGAVTVGDWVAVRLATGGTGAIEAVLPRRTLFARGSSNASTTAQPLAANVDLALVVHPLTQAPRLSRIERLLMLAWESGAQPVVVLTKADLAADLEAERAEAMTAAPGADVVAVSAVTELGLDDIRGYLAPGRTLALLGPSGAGKSTLVNAIAGHDVMATADIRTDGKGRHTTTHRELIVLPGVGVLVDTPGLRGVGVWHAEEGLERTFADVEELAARCRFLDCGHDSEPDCAVRAAVSAGTLTDRRVESYRKLQRELAWLAVRHDARARAERRREWIVRSRALRRDLKPRP